MKVERTVIVGIATTKEELENYLKDKQVVIFIEGELYKWLVNANVRELNEWSKKDPKDSRTNKVLKTTGKFGLAVGILGGGPACWVVGAMSLLASKLGFDIFEDYKVKENKKDKRIELYLRKGHRKYNPKEDTLKIPR